MQVMCRPRMGRVAGVTLVTGLLIGFATGPAGARVATDRYRSRSDERGSLASAPQARTCNDMPATITGTPGDDHLIGTPGDDLIIALGGRDRIEGRGGNDTICGGGGRDREIGGAGEDYMDGGDDQLAELADAGKPTADGADTISGGPGKDSSNPSTETTSMTGGRARTP